MVVKYLCIFVLWTKVALALEMSTPLFSKEFGLLRALHTTVIAIQGGTVLKGLSCQRRTTSPSKHFHY